MKKLFFLCFVFVVTWRQWEGMFLSSGYYAGSDIDLHHGCGVQQVEHSDRFKDLSSARSRIFGLNLIDSVSNIHLYEEDRKEIPIK